MWIINENDCGINLSKFFSIYFNPYSKTVKASSDDEDNTEYFIKKFDNEDDAKKYIADLVEKLNAEK